MPPSVPNVYQAYLGLGCLEDTDPRTEVPLVVPEMPSPDISNRKTRS